MAEASNYKNHTIVSKQKIQIFELDGTQLLSNRGFSAVKLMIIALSLEQVGDALLMGGGVLGPCVTILP